MLFSMTGFGRHAIASDAGELLWELRSVNHRFLEIALRLPDEYRAMESVIRQAISARLHRGKVDAVLRLGSAVSADQELELDQKVLSRLGNAFSEIEKNIANVAAVDPVKIMQWPGVIRTAHADQAALSKRISEGLTLALDDLVATRQREGDKMTHMLRSRAEQIAVHVASVKSIRPAVVTRQREKLLARLTDLEVEHDPQRLEQELVFVAQRLDIDEELDRLNVHVAELLKILERKSPVGRRLDFLLQEFNREANTLGSKAGDSDTTGATIEIKVLIEQMREQVQNIE